MLFMWLITLRPKKCDKTVRDDPFSLIYVPDWFVTQQVKIWHDDSEYHDNDRIVEWYDGYKKHRA